MVPIIYWYFPETKGLSLEEINELFGDEVVIHLTHISDEEKAKLDEVIGIENKETGTEPENGTLSSVMKNSSPTHIEEK